MASAKAATVEDLEEGGADAPVAKKRFPFLLIIIVAVLLIGGTGGAVFFLVGRHAHAAQAASAAATSSAAAAPAIAPAVYLAMAPSFVVNLADDEAMRFLQIDLEIMARNPKVIDAAKDHMPRLRNSMLMLFGQQRFHDLSTREAKEALRKQALDEIRHTLQEEHAPSEVEAVYFTSFVMQ